MPVEFDIVLLEKQRPGALTKADCMDLFDMLRDTEGIPIEVKNANGTSSAMGFIAVSVFEDPDYEHNKTKMFIADILNDTSKQNRNGCYRFQDTDIYLSE